MGTPRRTPSGKVIIWNAATGEAIERWPVDARGMLACGEFTAEPPSGASTPDQPVETAPREQPAAMPVEPRLPPEVEAVVGATTVVRGDAAPAAAPVTLPESAPRKKPRHKPRAR